MRKLLLLMVVVIAMAMVTSPADAATTDKGLVKSYCTKYFGMTPKYVKCGSKVLNHHKGKMLVEVVKTKSIGKGWGKTSKGLKVRYNKKVKKGRKVTSYLIYDPRTNAPDAVIAVVDCKKLRGDKPKVKAKVKADIHCPYCGDGSKTDCPYYCGFNNGTEYRHMTDKEIAEFEWYESHYQTEDGEWHVR